MPNNNLVCPDCHQTLIASEAEYVCPVCLAKYPIRSGIPCFTEGESAWRLIATEQRRELLALCKSQGYPQALRSYLNEADIIEWIMGEKRFPFQTLANVGSQAQVLDVGCGWGKTAFSVATFYKQVFCVDVETDGLEFINIRAQAEGVENLSLVCATAVKLPFPDDFFDLVFLNGSLEWIGTTQDDISACRLQNMALKEIARVTKSDGILFVGTENRFGLQYFAGYTEEHTGLKFISLLPRWLAKIYHRLAKGTSFRALTHSRWRLRRMLRQAGFNNSRWLALFPNYGFARLAASIDTTGALLFLITKLKLKPSRRARRLVQKALDLIALFPRTLSLLILVSPAWGIFASKQKSLLLKPPAGLSNRQPETNNQWVISISPHRALFLMLRKDASELERKYLFPLTEEKEQRQIQQYAFVKFLGQHYPEFSENVPNMEFFKREFRPYSTAAGVKGEPLSLKDVREMQQFFRLCLNLSQLRVRPDGGFAQIKSYDMRPRLVGIAEKLNLNLPMLQESGIVHGDLSCPNILTSAEAIVLLDWERAGIGPGILNWYDFLLKNIVTLPLRLPASPDAVIRRCNFLPGKGQAEIFLTRLTHQMLKELQLPLDMHRQLLLIYLAYLCEDCKDEIVTDKNELYGKLLQEQFSLKK